MAELPLPHHRLAVDRSVGPLRLAADLPLTAPWTLIFGPSGSGKSSLLRTACGLLGNAGVRFSRFEATGEQKLITPRHATQPHLLRLGYAPQQGALFPHLCVADNIRFPLAVRGETTSGPDSVEELLELFELAALRSRMPGLLSGGERQRVNLARAFAVPGVRLLLLDEPFSGAGRALRDRLLQRIQAWTQRRQVPVLSVSHEVDEALLVGADVVVLQDGKVARRAPAAEALATERERMLRTLTSGA